jgi:hypothetical protein
LTHQQITHHEQRLVQAIPRMDSIQAERTPGWNTPAGNRMMLISYRE